MNELVIDMKKKYPTFDITPQHLGQVIRDNNKTRKRTRHEHFPKERYKTTKNLTRKNRKPISYKITKLQVKTALELLHLFTFQTPI